MAKDVAAFANHFGGTLLVGASENAGTIGAYHPRSASDIANAENAITAAARARCSPVPTFNFARFAHGNDWVLAVNVWPMVSTLVGVRIKGDKNDGFGDDAWVFPTRIANHANWIRPEGFSMYMMPALRRTLLLLYAIPTGADGERVVVHAGAGSASTGEGRLVDVTEDENYLLVAPDHLRMSQVTRYPLDAVQYVYKHSDTPPTWRITIQF